jgi:hypothetical protein
MVSVHILLITIFSLYICSNIKPHSGIDALKNLIDRRFVRSNRKSYQSVLKCKTFGSSVSYLSVLKYWTLGSSNSRNNLTLHTIEEIFWYFRFAYMLINFLVSVMFLFLCENVWFWLLYCCI